MAMRRSVSPPAAVVGLAGILGFALASVDFGSCGHGLGKILATRGRV